MSNNKNSVVTCRICGMVDSHAGYTARELMFGSKEVFTYIQCSSCGCLQIADIPPDIGRHYPKDYYAHIEARLGYLRSHLRTWRNWCILKGPDILASSVGRRFSYPALASLRSLNLCREARVLDVGCGVGTLLDDLCSLGFRSVRGADPNIAMDIYRDNGVVIWKRHCEQLDGTWDVIMFHHSLEHMADQLSALKWAASALSDQGACVVRIPVIGAAWRAFGTNWVQLDAPRHFYLHSEKSFAVLANAAGLRISRSFYDSSAFQFWGSRQYEAGVSLFADDSYAVNPKRSRFARSEIKEFSRRALALNASRDGDQAVFVLQRAG